MSLSDEEFQRFQNQLVDLKTRNYQLEEQNKKISTGRHPPPWASALDEDRVRCSRKCSIENTYRNCRQREYQFTIANQSKNGSLHTHVAAAVNRSIDMGTSI